MGTVTTYASINRAGELVCVTQSPATNDVEVTE